MTGRLASARLPLFLRIFGLMLLTLLLVQALNFAVVLLVPPPQPTITTLDHVAAALRGTAKPGERLRLVPGAIEMPAIPGGREEGLRQVLAQRLMVPASDVRVRLRGRGAGPGPGPGGPPPMIAPVGPGPVLRATVERRLIQPDGQLVLIGEFAASARIDGTWRTLELASSGFAPWRRQALLWLAIAMLVVAPVAWLLAKGLARPIGLFADAARRLGRNPKAPPLDLTGPPEIREAASAFNEMQARLNRYVEDRTTLMAAIAHDLRTPLMRLNLRLEHAPEDVRQACESDIADMEQMIGAVMAFVRDMTRPTRRQRLDLRALVHSVTDDFADAGHAVRIGEGAPVVVEGDRSALKALLANLIGNAVKYAGSAEVSLGVEDGMAIIEVADAGPGMAPDDLDRAFEPFFRGERSRSRDTGGIGLGLASVRAVARAHGGDASLANRPGGGLLARVTLPL